MLLSLVLISWSIFKYLTLLNFLQKRKTILHPINLCRRIIGTCLNFQSRTDLMGLPWWSSGKESILQCRGRGFYPWSWN